MSSTDSSPAQSPQGHSRRAFMGKLGATGLAIGAGGAVGSQTMVGEADAVACGGLCVGAIAVGAASTGAFSIGWTLRDQEILGSDDPPEGVTADVLEEQVYQTTRKRQSNNASTFMDNGNILDGAEHVAWADGKIRAIEALNDQDTKANVTAAGQAAVDEYETVVKLNLLKSWKESAKELDNLLTAVSEHPDLAFSDVFSQEDWDDPETNSVYHPVDAVTFGTNTITLPDGEEFDLTYVDLECHQDNRGNHYSYDPRGELVNETNNGPNFKEVRIRTSAGDVDYLGMADWKAVWDDIGTICTDVRDGISLWVDKVYDQVQSGEIKTSELLTPREIAEMTAAEEEQFNQAVADLMALNIPVNLDREAEVHLPAKGTTLYGNLAVTGQTTLNAGDSIDPSADSHDYFLTYDVSEAHGTWGAFETGVDGGVVTFTEEPHPETLYSISTTDGETAEVSTGDFTQDGDTWTVNISEQVESAITSVDSVEFYSASDETNNVTVQLDESFEIVTFTDTETGEEHGSADYDEPTTPQGDDNYMTQEEWEAERDRMQDLIDQYKEETSDGGGAWLPNIGIPDVGGMVTGVFVLVGGVFVLGKALEGSGNN